MKRKTSDEPNGLANANHARASRTFPEYEDAITRMVQDALIGFHSQDPFFGKFRPHVSEHAGPVRNVRGDVPLDQPISGITFDASISHESVQSCDVDAFIIFVSELNEARMMSMAPGFFQKLNETISAVGNDVDAGGQPFTYDLYLKVLERMEITFDEFGHANLPTLVCGPELADVLQNYQPTEDDRRRLHQLLDKKKQEFNAVKRSRRLS